MAETTKKPQTPAQKAAVEKMRAARAAKQATAKPDEAAGFPPLTPELVQYMLDNITVMKIPASGRREEAYAVNDGHEITVWDGPHPEAVRNYPEEWEEYHEHQYQVNDSPAKTYPVRSLYYDRR